MVKNKKKKMWANGHPVGLKMYSAVFKYFKQYSREKKVWFYLINYIFCVDVSTSYCGLHRTAT